jgi:adenosylhomocysteine nucleosidase
MTIIAVTGLAREAHIAEDPEVVTVIGGGDSEVLSKRLEEALGAGGIKGVISFGIAAALVDSLSPGDCIVASHVADGDEIYPTDPDWAQRMLACLPDAITAGIAGSDKILTSAADKAALVRATGAHGADMESHIAARAAQQHGLPFAVLRAISDQASDALPPAASLALGTDGKIKFGAVARSVLRAPLQIPALMRTGIDAEAGFSALLRCRDLLGPGLLGPGAPRVDLG